MLEMGTVAIHWMDLGMITYLMLMLFLGWYYSGAVKNSEDYFLADRTLSWFVIGLSIIGSNVGSNDYVGGAGSAYRVGIAQANFEWTRGYSRRQSGGLYLYSLLLEGRRVFYSRVPGHAIPRR